MGRKKNEEERRETGEIRERERRNRARKKKMKKQERDGERCYRFNILEYSSAFLQPKCDRHLLLNQCQKRNRFGSGSLLISE